MQPPEGTAQSERLGLFQDIKKYKKIAVISWRVAELANPLTVRQVSTISDIRIVLVILLDVHLRMMWWQGSAFRK